MRLSLWIYLILLFLCVSCLLFLFPFSLHTSLTSCVDLQEDSYRHREEADINGDGLLDLDEMMQVCTIETQMYVYIHVLSSLQQH